MRPRNVRVETDMLKGNRVREAQLIVTGTDPRITATVVIFAI